MSLELSGTTPAIKGVAGSVSAPAITGDDADTGISFPSANTIKFSTGGVERMAITDSGVSGISAGITMADQWRITSNLSSSSGTFNANWERVDTEFDKLGTGLTQSSGVFSFPSNGLYLLHFHSTGAGNGDRYMGVILKVSTDNGANYSTRVENYASVYNSGNNTWGNVSIDVLLDVTNYADFKFYINHSSSGTITWYGDTNNTWTGLYTLRIGDT